MDLSHEEQCCTGRFPPCATDRNDANYQYFNSSSLTDSTNFLTPVGYFVVSPGPYGTFDRVATLAME